jgi:hypothetical protein
MERTDTGRKTDRQRNSALYLFYFCFLPFLLKSFVVHQRFSFVFFNFQTKFVYTLTRQKQLEQDEEEEIAIPVAPSINLITSCCFCLFFLQIQSLEKNYEKEKKL